VSQHKLFLTGQIKTRRRRENAVPLRQPAEASIPREPPQSGLKQTAKQRQPSRAAGCYEKWGQNNYILKHFFTFARASESQAPTAAPTERPVLWRGKPACVWETGSFQQ